MNKNIFFIILVVLIISAGIYMSNSTDAPGNDQESNISRVRLLDEKRETNNGDNAIREEEVGFGGAIADEQGEEISIKASGEYLDYDPKLLARADDGDVVLFFHATWCPSCKTLDTGLKKDLDKFPADLTILKLDYDKASDLKKKYAITYQHTLVQVDAQGNQITKWNGGNGLSDVLDKLK